MTKFNVLTIATAALVALSSTAFAADATPAHQVAQTDADHKAAQTDADHKAADDKNEDAKEAQPEAKK